MKRRCYVWLTMLVVAGCAEPAPRIKQPLPPVAEACAVLKDFRGEYSYGGVGIVSGDSNDGELAVWTVFHAPDAAKQLAELLPQCQPAGKAYVLAALYQADRAAFRKLTNAFCQESGDIIVGSGCIIWTETRAELVVQMQRSQSTLAFYLSRPPRRVSQFGFLGNHPDVYAERQAWEQAEQASKDRALSELKSNPALGVFTNFFRVEDAEVSGGYAGVYFDAESTWGANLVPRESFSFTTKVAVAFPETNGVAQVGVQPEALMAALRDVTSLPFIRDLDRELGVTLVGICAAGDRLHWNTKEVERLEETLQTHVPARTWVTFDVDVGTNNRRLITIYHPKGQDLYVVKNGLFESPRWRDQYEKLTGKKPTKMKPVEEGVWNEPDKKFIPVVDQTGKLRLVGAPER